MPMKAMSLKRRHSAVDAPSEAPANISKRLRHLHPEDRFSALSDELLIRILHFLPISSLIVVQQLSHRLSDLATDSQLWKSLYYNRFVLPRALQLPGLRVSRSASGAKPVDRAQHLHFSSRKSKWLDEHGLVNRSDGKVTNWKKQYKLRHNWAIGSCGVTEVQTGTPAQGQDSSRDRNPALLARLVEGVVVTVDVDGGLRAWDIKAGTVIASQNLEQHRVPSALATSSGGGVSGDGEEVCVAVGFMDGGFTVWSVDISGGIFLELSSRKGNGEENAALDGIAYSYPYLLCITEAQVLSLYSFKDAEQITTEADMPVLSDLSTNESHSSQSLQPSSAARSGRLLTSLKSHTAWPPLTLSIRSTSQNIIASIAYALPTYLSGWSVGLQELHLTPTGTILSSRLTSAIEQGFHSLASSSHFPARERNMSRPTSLSYSHPYLLASHPDNTLTLYLVTSVSNALTISKGTKLWGHTSSVSGAEVGGRGKAVSVSARGNEVRVWELEGSARSSSTSSSTSTSVPPSSSSTAFATTDSTSGSGLTAGGPSSSSSSRRKFHSRSVAVKPARWTRAGELADDDDAGSGDSGLDDFESRKGWVGFDDENVIVLKETREGTRALMIYDFT